MKRISRIVIAALLFALGGCAQEQLTTLDIFYTADTEGFYWSRPEPRFENKVVGGYAVLKKFLATQEQPYLLFDGGNWFGAASEGNLMGENYPRLAQTIPYHAAAVTDKEFGMGWPYLRGIIREMPFPFLVSNLKLDRQIPWPMHDYQIFTVGQIKIGVFALVSPVGMERLKSRLPGFAVRDALETAREMTALLRDKGVDYVILLSALGDADKQGLNDAALAEEVEGIDLILSANKDHEQAETEVRDNTWLVYPGARLDSISRIRLFFDKNKQLKNTEFEDIVLYADTYGADNEIVATAVQMQADTQNKMKARVTQTEKALDVKLDGEMVLGNLLTDCLHKWAKLDGAILNSDSIRYGLPEGVVSEYDVYRMYPYGDNITFITIKGRDLLRALEASLAVKDNFPQIAGFHVNYKDTPKGKTIQQIVLDNGRIVRPQDTYRFAVTDHVMAGGFGHDEFINALEFKNTFVEARQIMRACLVRQKKVALPSTGRWKK